MDKFWAQVSTGKEIQTTAIFSSRLKVFHSFVNLADFDVFIVALWPWGQESRG